jgi:hypothetical protein
MTLFSFIKASKNILGYDRASPLISFTFESSDDENKSPSQSPRSKKTKKSPSISTDSFMKRVSTQTPPDILRSTSLSSLNIPKQQSNALVSTGNVTRPRTESQEKPPGVSATRITPKKAYATEPLSSKHFDQHRSHSSKQFGQHQSHSPEHFDQHRSHSPEHFDQHRSHSSIARRSNDKSQIVTYSSIIQATRQQQQLIDLSPTIDMKKVLKKF